MLTADNPYLSRSKPFGLPFHAAYPITAEIKGAPTKRARRTSPSTIGKYCRSIAVERSSRRL
jgi:hypothetical protein